MKADAQPLSDILSNNIQYLIPFFQRSYSWERDNWDRLGDDIQSLLVEDLSKKHFLGPLVCSLQSALPGKVSQYQLIDGQQRLTTLSVLLVALRDEAKRVGDAKLAAQIERHYLINEFEEKLDRYKLLPRTGDRELFSALVDRKRADDPNSRLTAAHDFFMKFIRTHAHNDDQYLRKLFDTIVGRLFLVAITLEKEDPYEIFESLNSTGLPLLESDLIRNFLFMQIPLEEQGDFQNEHWAPFEAEFEPAAGESTIAPTAFYRDFLMRGGEYSKAKETFSDFKKYFEEQDSSPTEMVGELRRFAGHAKSIVNYEKVTSPKVAKVLRHFVWMEASTAYPVVLNLLEQRHQKQLSDDDFVSCMSDLNSFILRRSICGESTRAYGRWFCELAGQLTGAVNQNIRAYLLHRGWPDDETFQRSLVDFPIYRREFKKCRIVLEMLERADGHKEVVDLEKIQIEHIMPQKLPSGPAGKEWRQMLGERPKRTHERWVHTLGNLTLTGYNQTLSNRAFSEKRNELVESKLSLNKIFETAEMWGEDQIRGRGQSLAAEACVLWPRPESDVKYVPPVKSGGTENKGKQRRTEYWRRFGEVLETSGVSLRPVRKIEGRICDFFLPMADVNLAAKLVTNKKQLTIEFRFARPRGKKIFEGLLAHRETIDAGFEFPPAWDNCKKPTITFTRPDVSIRDQYDWLDQHNWMVRILGDIESDLLGRIRSLHEAVQEKSESKQAFIDFWIGFHKLLFEEKSQLLATTPLPQHWNNLAIGRSGVWIETSISPSKSCMTVMLIMGTKKSPIFFPQLAADKESIEQAVGQSLHWNNSPDLKQWRIELTQTDVDFSNRDNWPAYQRWMFDNLNLFDVAFRERIQNLKVDDESDEEEV
ncbi:DUF4268 domain-containing protein [Crateriforma spongiae]|uniref:DUF4268 domain-containing protein n=1 Tax=Crateriforma spongiae TaxID=2724528 RepID=UPI00144619DB|nr:DUF4268 domain-containing protein [Crateriforma spongiae]